MSFTPWGVDRPTNGLKINRDLLLPEMPMEMWLDYAGAVGEEKPVLRSVRQFVYRAYMRRRAELGGGAGVEDQMVMLEAGGMVG